MKLSAVLSILAACLGFALVPGSTPQAGAQETITLKIGTLAPRRSAWHRVFEAWKGSVQEESEGRLRLRFYYGGSQGDERDYIRKMGAGQLDGAAMTTTGLGQIVRPVLVLSSPGIFSDYRQIDRVRNRLSDEFQSQFEEAGYHNAGWGDVGRARLFSNRPILRPRDLRQTRPWQWREDTIFGEFLRAVGANGQRLGVNEVLPALQTGRIDAFPSTALAATSLQWFNHATHVTKQSDAIVIGATVIKKERYDALPADLRAIFDSTSERAHAALQRSIRRADDRAYQAILRRNITEVDISANEAEWQRVADQVRRRLAGRVYPPQLLAQVERVAGR
jgi:TRAP-type C4-dicarboxylate transport system substrate-binding protein